VSGWSLGRLVIGCGLFVVACGLLVIGCGCPVIGIGLLVIGCGVTLNFFCVVGHVGASFFCLLAVT
jgi:hypothetical protein